MWFASNLTCLLVISILTFYSPVIPPIINSQPTSPLAVTLIHNMSKTKTQIDQNTPHSQNSLPSNLLTKLRS